MKLRDLSELAARNLREAILRNSLHHSWRRRRVASLVAMLSLGVGLQTLANDRSPSPVSSTPSSSPRRREFRGPGGDGPPRKTSAPPEKSSPSTTTLVRLREITQRHRRSTRKSASSPTVRFGQQHLLHQRLGVPESSRSASAFDGIVGKYFSSPTAEEAILQQDFAKDLSPQPASLVGKEITLRYAERRSLSSDEIAKEKDIDAQLDAMMSGAASPSSPARKNFA